MRNFLIVVFSFFSLSFYGQNDTLSDNEQKNISQVFIKTKNVIYRGIKNEIFITVPNSETLTASSPGLSIEKDRFFILPTSGTEQKLFLRFKKNDGTYVNEVHLFKIDQIKDVLGLINGNNCNNCIVLLKREKLLNFKISIKIPNHPFIEDTEAGGFKVSLNSKMHNKELLWLIKELF